MLIKIRYTDSVVHKILKRDKMKKRIIFVLIAVLAVTFSLPGSAAPKFLKKVKDKIVKKDEKKAAPVSANVVLLKGLQLTKCGRDVIDNGSISIPSLNNVKITVVKGKFDLSLPTNPVFSTDEWELGQQAEEDKPDFGTAKVYPIRIMFFENSRGNDEAIPSGRSYLGVKVFYSDKDVEGTIPGQYGDPVNVKLKKGWNIIGDKTELEVSMMCAG